MYTIIQNMHLFIKYIKLNYHQFLQNIINKTCLCLIKYQKVIKDIVLLYLQLNLFLNNSNKNYYKSEIIIKKIIIKHSEIGSQLSLR